MGDAVRSDIGSFSIVPHWLVDAGASPQAIALFVILGSYADNDTGECWPSRATLAARLGQSRDSVDRRLKELRALGAVEWQQRKDEAGQRSNLYTLHLTTPCRSDTAPGNAETRHGGGVPVRHRTRPNTTRPKGTGSSSLVSVHELDQMIAEEEAG